MSAAQPALEAIANELTVLRHGGSIDGLAHSQLLHSIAEYGDSEYVRGYRTGADTYRSLLPALDLESS